MITTERSRLLKFCLVAAMNTMCTAFCDVTPCSLVDMEGLRTFGRNLCIHVQDISATEAAGSETSVPF